MVIQSEVCRDVDDGCMHADEGAVILADCKRGQLLEDH